VTLKHEDHWLSRSETRLQMLTAMVRFLNEHNPVDAPDRFGTALDSNTGAAPR